ncbi:MAG: hypothetical protein JWO89_1940 [Verrucomicrobiaceae bacterium]|nr:hypothetical protein [Verrucomicrobiaceae bacterium]
MTLTHTARTILTIAALLGTSAFLQAQPGDDLIAKGEACDENLEAAQALSYLLPAEKLQPKNAHLLVCIARQYRHLMSDANSNAEKMKLGAIALQYSNRAADVGPSSSEAQLAPAITYGKLLPLESKGAQIEASKSIKASFDKALKLDPGNDLAWHVAGRWHRVLADVSSLKRTLASLVYQKLPTSTNEAAVKCFEKAIESNPKRPMHYIELGRVYAQMGRADEARRLIQKGLAMPNTEKDDPETKQRGREALAAL